MATAENTKPASRICVWQASLLADVFSGNSAPITPQDEEAHVSGVDFELFDAIKVPSPRLEQDRASYLVVLVGNHPAGITEVPLFSELQTHPSTVILHPSSTCLQPQEEGHDGHKIFQAINSTSFPIGSLKTHSSAFLLRVSQNASIELWKPASIAAVSQQSGSSKIWAVYQHDIKCADVDEAEWEYSEEWALRMADKPECGGVLGEIFDDGEERRGRTNLSVNRGGLKSRPVEPMVEDAKGQAMMALRQMALVLRVVLYGGWM
ncbi:hypothetical protein VP01_480g10 [Puccinia sorghi]|uniref:Uncharacterized protein n=1 Tax=Puccinia sorghi TaxID=27349 RepID=A0A0L6UML0_9BASI|nr:hypothetical protein VP01_480g10 [Puccinia sorghi]